MSRIDEYRKKVSAVEEIELPVMGSAVVKIHVSVLDLAAAGQIPTTLLAEMAEMSKGGKGGGTEMLPRILPALDALALAAFVDPPVTRDGGDDSLSLAEITVTDKIALFARLNGAAETLRPFRGETGQPD
ncbi:MAG TPA: hypothetical protein PK205_18750 [Promineifilum sp.]|nr:hypothetical protein [Promineifilum sp.]